MEFGYGTDSHDDESQRLEAAVFEQELYGRVEYWIGGVEALARGEASDVDQQGQPCFDLVFGEAAVRVRTTDIDEARAFLKQCYSERFPDLFPQQPDAA